MASAPALDPKTAEILRNAMGAAQRGDLARARHVAEQGLMSGGDIVALNAFLGMILARSGELSGAARHLRRAHEARPLDITIACNLVSVLIDAKDLETALSVASRDLALADPSLRLARYRGFIAQSLERFEDAVEAYAHVVARAPSDFESWNNLGNAKSAVEDYEGSVQALQKAVALDPKAAPSRLNLAVALRNAGRTDEAETMLRQAMQDFPADARLANELYVLLKRVGKHEDAFPIIEEAVRRDPNSASFQLKWGVECGMVNRLDDAEHAYRAAIAIDPTLAEAYFGLMIQYEYTNREEEFGPLIAQAQTNGLSEGALLFLQAIEHRRAKRFKEGLDALARVPEAIESERTPHIRGTMLDRIGEYDAAFDAFSETNRRHQDHPSAPLARAAAFRERLKDQIELLTPEWAQRLRQFDTIADRTSPVFLVGFPRSGTTLLDTILMGHPGTVVLEEEPPLNLVDKELGGMAMLPSLDGGGIEKARQHYFDEVRMLVDPSGKMLIDKSPLFLQKLPLIHCLFPDAKIILALRHPCDVVLSCFMSNFKLNDAMSNFLRLEDAAEFYDLTFRHWERARALLSPSVHTIVYEQLVDDVEGAVRPLFDWLGLDWNDAALDHQRTAKSRGLISTASYSQVTEPIYKRSAGRWVNYRRHLEPVLPILEPWAQKFGYTLDI